MQKKVRIVVSLILFSSLFEKNRLIDLFSRLGSQREVVSFSFDQRNLYFTQAFPFVVEVNRIKGELDARGIRQITLVSASEGKEISNEVTQRLSEFLYPIVILDESSHVLKVKEDRKDSEWPGLKLELLKR